jgi:hypothetical protein
MILNALEPIGANRMIEAPGEEQSQLVHARFPAETPLYSTKQRRVVHGGLNDGERCPGPIVEFVMDIPEQGVAAVGVRARLPAAKKTQFVLQDIDSGAEFINRLQRHRPPVSHESTASLTRLDGPHGVLGEPMELPSGQLGHGARGETIGIEHLQRPARNQLGREFHWLRPKLRHHVIDNADELKVIQKVTHWTYPPYREA